MKWICAGIVAGFISCALPVLALEPGNEQVLYSFCRVQNCTDGENPSAGLIEANGTIYGTTVHGGVNNAGTVFALDPGTGKEKVLYSFCNQQNCADGGEPFAGVIAVKSVLYGATYTGGRYGSGTVFSLDRATGIETVLHSFGRGKDGSSAYSGLLHGKDTLYGTTYDGGAHGGGIVYALDLNTGAENVVYSFCRKTRKCKDGANPFAGLINMDGTIYGTTEYGGGRGWGTVFSLDPNSGTQKVLYGFCREKKCVDGKVPTMGLTAAKGSLYGSTEYGGAAGQGALFALTPSTGAETLLYSFCSQENCPDGADPDAALIAAHGKLYGTSYAGGRNNNGTVFSFDLNSGTETVLHAFKGGQDGKGPGGSLIEANGMLFGTTMAGGSANGGTVFVIRRP
jgi:uncharacterized repeat protein (TIGR03803 family)